MQSEKNPSVDFLGGVEKVENFQKVSDSKSRGVPGMSCLYISYKSLL